MKKINSEQNYFQQNMLDLPQTTRDAKKTSRKIKYFPINTSDSQSGGHTFYLATQENDGGDEFNINNLSVKNSTDTINNFKNDKKQIIPQKSIILQIDNVKPILNRNLNNKQIHSHTQSKNTEQCEKIIVNKRQSKNEKNKTHIKKENILKIPVFKNTMTKKILEGAKTLKSCSFKKHSNKILRSFQNEKLQEKSILDFYKLNLNSKILDKMNRNKNNDFKKIPKPLNSSINLCDDNYFTPDINFVNIIQINESNKIKNENENEKKNKNYNYNTIDCKIDKTSGNSREKELTHQKYKNNPIIKKRKKPLNKRNNEKFNIIEKPTQTFDNNNEINKNNKLLKSSDFYVKKTLLEERYFIDGNGNKRLLKIEEISGCDPENKTEKLDKVKQRIKCCYSINPICNKNEPREIYVKSICRRSKNNTISEIEKQDISDLYYNINSNLNHYKNLIKVNRETKFNTTYTPKIFAKLEEKKVISNTTVNSRSKSKNHSYHEIKGFSKKTKDRNHSEKRNSPIKFNNKRFGKIIRINNDTSNGKIDDNFIIKKRFDSKLLNSNSEKNEYKLINIRERPGNKFLNEYK